MWTKKRFWKISLYNWRRYKSSCRWRSIDLTLTRSSVGPDMVKQWTPAPGDSAQWQKCHMTSFQLLIFKNSQIQPNFLKISFFNHEIFFPVISIISFGQWWTPFVKFYWSQNEKSDDSDHFLQITSTLESAYLNLLHNMNHKQTSF